MTLTNDTFYWWCSVPAVEAPSGTRYRFLLNDNVEVLDPAARDVYKIGAAFHKADVPRTDQMMR